MFSKPFHPGSPSYGKFNRAFICLIIKRACLGSDGSLSILGYLGEDALNNLILNPIMTHDWRDKKAIIHFYNSDQSDNQIATKLICHIAKSSIANTLKPATKAVLHDDLRAFSLFQEEADLYSLLAAVVKGSTKWLSYFKDNKIDLLKRSYTLWLNLATIATKNGYEECLRMLMAEGRGLVRSDYLGQDLVNLACAAAMYGHLGCLLVLKEMGCNFDEVDKGFETPAHWAARFGQEHCIRFLNDQGCNFRQVNNCGETLAFLAAENGHEACLCFLKVIGCDLNQADNIGRTPAQRAAKNGHYNCLSLLNNSGCNLQQEDNYGYSPAHRAAGFGHEKCLKLLKEAKCDLGKPAFNSTTSLHIAAENGHKGCLRLLIEAGHNLKQLDRNGQTPVHKAAMNGHEGCLILLKEAGCDLFLKDKHGNTPIHLAEKNGHKNCQRLLNDALQKKQEEEDLSYVGMACLDFIGGGMYF